MYVGHFMADSAALFTLFILRSPEATDHCRQWGSAYGCTGTLGNNLQSCFWNYLRLFWQDGTTAKTRTHLWAGTRFQAIMPKVSKPLGDIIAVRWPPLPRLFSCICHWNYWICGAVRIYFWLPLRHHSIWTFFSNKQVGIVKIMPKWAKYKIQLSGYLCMAISLGLFYFISASIWMCFIIFVTLRLGYSMCGRRCPGFSKWSKKKKLD